MSIRLRITVLLAVLVAAATVTVGLATYRATVDQVMSELDESLTTATRPFFETRPGGPRSLPVRTPLVLYEAQILDPQGRVLATTFTPPVPATAEARGVVNVPGQVLWETLDVDGSQFRVRTVGLVSGAIQVARPFDETQRVLDGVRARILALVVGTTAVALTLGWWITGPITASLRRLTVAMEAVEAQGGPMTEGDVGDTPHLQVPLGGGHEVRALAGAFTAMLGALRRSRAEQRRLVEDAGHELRTPLTSLRTNLGLLQRHENLPTEERREILTDLVAETEELVALVDEIVLAATGEISAEEPEWLSLIAVARTAAERAARRSGRTVEVHLLGASCEVHAMPDALSRAIANLIDNALKFDTSGGPVEVVVNAGRLEVRDRGPGIPPESHSAVFERFFRTPEARAATGSGLGLAIVREVVQRHGGEVFVESRAGGGAVVGFTVPARLSPPTVVSDSDLQ